MACIGGIPPVTCVVCVCADTVMHFLYIFIRTLWRRSSHYARTSAQLQIDTTVTQHGTSI